MSYEEALSVFSLLEKEIGNVRALNETFTILVESSTSRFELTLVPVIVQCSLHQSLGFINSQLAVSVLIKVSQHFLDDNINLSLLVSKTSSATNETIVVPKVDIRVEHDLNIVVKVFPCDSLLVPQVLPINT